LEYNNINTCIKNRLININNNENEELIETNKRRVSLENELLYNSMNKSIVSDKDCAIIANNIIK